MNCIDMIKMNFPDVKVYSDKVETDNQVYEILEYLKKTYELSFDILLTVIAVDYTDYIELIYPLLSTYMNERVNISTKVREEAVSVTSLYPSAYFDECEIYDLFGIRFVGNKKLKRLFMPSSWIGHPLRKNYELKDTRLSWNE